MRFSVVIATAGRPEPLAETLASLAGCDPPPAEVLVVDGDPARSAEAVVASAYPDARHVVSEPGLTRQRNVGIREATGDVVVFVDDDVALAPDLFARLEEAYADPAVVGATGRVLEPAAHGVGAQDSRVRRWLLAGEPGTFTRFGYPRYVTDGEAPRDVEVMLGCFMTARRAVAAAVGFDEQLSGYALAEDEDFSYRLSRVGRVRYVPAAVVEHRKLGFAAHDGRALARAVVANRAYLFRKNFPQTPRARAQFALFLLVLLAHRLVNREWKAALGLVEGAIGLVRGRSHG